MHASEFFLYFFTNRVAGIAGVSLPRGLADGVYGAAVE